MNQILKVNSAYGRPLLFQTPPPPNDKTSAYSTGIILVTSIMSSASIWVYRILLNQLSLKYLGDLAGVLGELVSWRFR